MASSGGDEGEYGLQIAPILDLLFVLLLFFMVSAGSKARENELGIKIPTKGGAAPGTVEVPVTLKIDAQGQVFWNDSPIDTARSRELDGLRARLKDTLAKFGETQPVIIAPHRTTRHERVVDVLNAASASQVKNLSFAAASF